MPRIVRSGPSNPLIALSAEEVLAALRKAADDMGFSDRETLGVQINTEITMSGKFHSECPELFIMVSNIPNRRSHQQMSREKAEDDARLFGTGFTRTHPDGRVEHLPADQICIYPAKINVQVLPLTEEEKRQRVFKSVITITEESA